MNRLENGSGAEQKPRESWESPVPNESPKSFKAFCLFRAMGLHRSIKGCMELHGIEAKKYGTWSRWARMFDWNNRAMAYDEYIAKETERQLIAERVERKKRQIEILNGFDDVVANRVKTLKAEDLNADEAMDLLERSAKLDGFLAGADEDNKTSGGNQLQLVFAKDFENL
ncbi:hypothetical protein [Treponema sp.]|uniref:hypothetical protein n=1 Tax=Treponema sp. TaxID=166 RepID=UPI002A8342D8|nr:hypothetical protein [Treponema sp.]MCI6441655.1 hypothetical protein [Spirochaetia bacterium]MDY4132310.1 hypothetical protein [Treponema sp.]